MAEVEFERRLERMFGDAPHMADADGFARRVEARLHRGQIARRWLIGAAGLVGGAIAANQLLMTNFAKRIDAVESSARTLSMDLSAISASGQWLSALSGGGTGVWVAAGVAIAGMGFVLSRVIEEI